MRRKRKCIATAIGTVCEILANNNNNNSNNIGPANSEADYVTVCIDFLKGRCARNALKCR